MVYSAYILKHGDLYEKATNDFDFVCLGIGAIFLTFVAILQNCGINITNGSVIGIIITVLLFTLILLSTANVLGFDCTVSNITFLRPILLFIALYIFIVCRLWAFSESREMCGIT